MKKMVCIETDQLNSIMVVRDHYKGVVVQVVRHTDQLKPTGPNGEMTNIKTNQVIWSKEVPIGDSKLFKDRVEKVVSEARDRISAIKFNDKAIDGLLNDYESQVKGKDGL